MNVFAKFEEIPSMVLQDIKETKRLGHSVGRLFVRTDNVKTVNTLPQTQFAGGIKSISVAKLTVWLAKDEEAQVHIHIAQMDQNFGQSKQCTVL